MDITKLSEPFPPSQISWRVGATNADKSKGIALAYLDARDVMDRLDTVCTPAGWQCTYTHADKIVICSIGVKIGNEWVWKANGAGETDVEAEKGATSDAFKRAAVLWGIGRYLYNVKDTWVLLEPKGKSYVIKDTEYKKLEGLLGSGNKPAAKPEPKAPAPELTAEQKLAKAKDWVENAINTLEKHMLTNDSAAIDQWMTANNKTLQALKEKHADLFDQVMKTVGM